ncbi:hypothetical protein BDV96DRAFT_606472 [Lophiotrema nucula]|uniref:Uncharacterized protein n=1 Tax=Lophiotrema nucula TaxID=690887 RepID=A0A6A5YKE7_9PLEO|nr:hypothetical protein BDV96DRAFT_606472 [Lophiotrema nucula]
MFLAGGVFPLDQMYPESWKGANFNPMQKCLREGHVLTKSHKCCVENNRCTKSCFINLHYFFCQAPMRDENGDFQRDEHDRVICCWERVGVKCQEGCWLHKYNNGEYINEKFYQYNKEFKRVYEGADLFTLKDEYWPWYLNRDGTYNYGRPEPVPEQLSLPAPAPVPSNAQPTYNKEDLKKIVLEVAVDEKKPGKKLNVHEFRKAATFSIMCAFPNLSEKEAAAAIKETYDGVKHAEMIADQKARKEADEEEAEKKAQRKEQKRKKLQDSNEASRQGQKKKAGRK